MLHLRSEVSYARAVKVLDLGQRGTRDDVAAVVELALLRRTVLHFGQRTLRQDGEGCYFLSLGARAKNFDLVRTRIDANVGFHVD